MFEGQEKKKPTEREGQDYSYMVGNEYWKLRRKHGRNRVFETPDDFWNACVEYFDWCNDNPLYEAKAFASGMIVKLPKMRVMSINGACNHMGISKRCWDNYRGRKEFESVVLDAETVMTQYKMEGAAAGLLNGNIIARDLGLADKVNSQSHVTVEVIDNYDDDPDSE